MLRRSSASMAIIITPPKRVCDICEASVMEGASYQFPVPSVLTDNSGLDFKATG